MAPDKMATLDISSLRAAYDDGGLTPVDLVEAVIARLSAYDDPALWISRVDDAALRSRAAQLAASGPDGLALYGIPFAVKDNIDVAGLATTAACPEFAYTPERSATAVQRLIDAGAILIGKTNLDQFATGLVGVRSPYGVPRNPFDVAYIPGGSSSGSAVAVSAGLVSFSLGTDTAGSGRVPAAFNNIVGLKPSCGLLSTRGVVPACRSLDCISIFALTAGDAADVLSIAAGHDPEDPFSRVASHESVPLIPSSSVRFGVPRPEQLTFFGDANAQALFAGSVARLESLGGKKVEIDFAPFDDAARLLYDGPWVDERRAAVGGFIADHPEAAHPVTRKIVADARPYTAVEAYQGFYRLKALKAKTAPVWQEVDILLLPTAGTIYTVTEVEADPIKLNSNLGRYTNFMNLLDLCGIAVPGGFLPSGLPLGVTLVAPAFADASLARLADRLHRASGVLAGATGQPLPPEKTEDAAASKTGAVNLAVVGAHLSGMPLNHELTERGATFVRAAKTGPSYRLYALSATVPPKPGLVRSKGGHAIEVEIWSLPTAAFGDFVANVPEPLGIGTLELDDGTKVKGFICESYAVQDAREISSFGGWRAFVGSLAQASASGLA